MSEYPSKLEELLENLELTYDRDERIQMLIDIADRFKGVPDHIAIRPYPVVKITQISTEVVYRIFGRELSMGKNMGLTSLLSMVQACARRYQDSGQADSNGVNGLFNE